MAVYASVGQVDNVNVRLIVVVDGGGFLFIYLFSFLT